MAQIIRLTPGGFFTRFSAVLVRMRRSWERLPSMMGRGFGSITRLPHDKHGDEDSAEAPQISIKRPLGLARPIVATLDN
jgi:hypothetical protein